MNEAIGYLWPTDDQMLLLHAALDEPAAARAAFERWCDRVDLSGPVDQGSLGLLPQVHYNLAGDGVTLRHAGLIAGVRRRAFVESHRAIGAAGQALALLHAAGFRAMMMKGVPLALDYYAEPGLRPMSDADILVRPEHAKPALAALEAGGWRTAAEFDARRQRHLMLSHAIELRRGPGAAVDLHWHPIHESLPPRALHRLWANAVPIGVGESRALRPDASSLLLQVVLHGLRRSFKAPLRWIPDAMMILRKEGDRIDWDWLLAASRESRTSWRLSLALRFLADHFAADIPPEVTAEAGRTRPSLVERLENRFILGTTPGAFSTNSYKAAILLRMLTGERRGAVPGLLWRETLRRVGAAQR